LTNGVDRREQSPAADASATLAAGVATDPT
jgi:hypothetical protein